MNVVRSMKFLPLLLLVAAGPAVQTTEERNEAGELEARYAVAGDGTRDGDFTKFYPGGKTKESGTYRKGQLEGSFYAFHPNGKTSIRCTYRVGALDGPYNAFDERGQKTASTDYKAGKRHGVVREYKDDKLIVEQVYIDDALIYPRSPAIIAGGLAEIRRTKIDTAASNEAPPDHKGQAPADRDAAVQLLMEYRYLCNVPHELSLDAKYNAHDEAAGALMAQLGKLTHNPPNPGWTEADFKFAHTGCASSNIFVGSPRASAAVRAFMYDSDASNIDRLGHRRWCLNPAMGKTGFGGDKNYIAMWAMDGSRKDVPDFDYAAYPAPGLFPTTHFDASAAWSISVNPKKFLKPEKANVKVTVKAAQVSQTPLALKIGMEAPLNYTNVETSNFGLPNAVIFRPEKCSTKPGSAYIVEIAGLQTKDKAAAPIKYLVEFYAPGK